MENKSFTLSQQINYRLKNISRFGESRHLAKEASEAQNYIYSYNTFKMYARTMNHFAD